MRKFSEIKLAKGNHKPETDLCVMEAVAYFAGERHSDRAACACPAITSFAIAINDMCTDEQRQRLKPYIPLIVGTRDGNELKRAELFTWKAIRVSAPYWLRRARLNHLADELAEFNGSFFEARELLIKAKHHANAA